MTETQSHIASIPILSNTMDIVKCDYLNLNYLNVKIQFPDLTSYISHVQKLHMVGD